MPGTDVPCLPGFRTTFDNRKRFGKAGHFDVGHGGLMIHKKELRNLPNKDRALIFDKDAQLKDTRTEPIEGAQKSVWVGVDSVPRGGDKPRWIEYSGHVLRFFAWFKEPVYNSTTETERLRTFSILYFLEDFTVKVVEDKVVNSGMPQGTFLERCKVFRETTTGRSQQYVDHTDFKVGADIIINGRTFHIVDADDRTRETYFWKWDMVVADKLPVPTDKWNKDQAKIRKMLSTTTHKKAPFIEFRECMTGVPPRSTFVRERQMLANDRKVLRFWCTWNDTGMNGGKKYYRLQYYLADDSLEIEEDKHKKPDGTGSMTMLVKRCKLPKGTPQRTVAKIGFDPYFDPVNVVTAKDLAIGSYIDVFGRKMLLTRADPYTIMFYKKVYGMTDKDFTPIEDKVEKVELPKPVIPPRFMGFGTEEDTLGSVHNLEPKPCETVDSKRLHRYGTYQLNWRAKMVSDRPQDQDRKFVITHWMADQGVMVYEEVTRNSGFQPGKFMEKSTILTNPATGKKYEAEDFVVGQSIVINGFEYIITEVDGRADAYLKSGKHVFYSGSLKPVLMGICDAIWSRNKDLSRTFRQIDADFSNTVDPEEIKRLGFALGWRLKDEDAEKIFAAFDRDGSGSMTVKEFTDKLEAIIHDGDVPEWAK